ncbi:MAG TPA: DUF418 domain-containing protein [Phnomibacter sp.]|nr:DUF418 domain-containing protein [Phnomibacter sp.]
MQKNHIPSQQRYSLLDALRGFAIFGIFGVNMMASTLSWFGQDIENMHIWFGSKPEKIFQVAIEALVEGKFYSMFSLLFGIGFGLQLGKHTDAGINGLPIFKRRLWGLLFIGFMHMMLLWVGDILFLYAWLGFILIAFRHKSDRYLLWAALICLAVPVILFPLRIMHESITLGTPLYALLFGLLGLLGMDLQQMNMVEMSTSPGWGNYFFTNLIAFFFRQADLFDQVRPFKVFAMFLVGFWVSRHRWYQTPEVFLQKFRKWIPIVLPIALCINVAMAYVSWDAYYSASWMGWLKTWLYFLGVVPLSLCYVYLFTAAYISGRYPVLHAFTYVGRMALSNYLFQSVIYVIIFRWPFFALAGKWGSIICMAPVLVIYPLQIVFSKWWLSRYRYGPAEWLWRSMTYRQWQPMKRNDNETPS